ncbi:unnamed protein product [Withania somnifera]
MQVVVEIMTGTVFHVQVGNDATVQDLKIAIHNQENVPGDRLILLLDTGGDHLMMNDDQKSLSEYGVQDGSHLYALFKPLEAEKDDDDVDTGDDKVMDKDMTESETDEERDNNNSDDDSGSSTTKTLNEDTTVESPEYISISD